MNGILRKLNQEVSMVERIIAPGDKVEMRASETVRLPDGTEGRKLYKTTVFDILEDDKVVIAMPLEKTKLVLLPVEGEYDVCFITSAGMYKSQIRIVDRKKQDNNYVLVTELLTGLSKYQRREYYRFNCVVETQVSEITEELVETIQKKLYHLLPEGASGKGIIVDISGGGMRFVSKEHYEPNQLIYIKFILPIGGSKKQFRLAAKVISSEELEKRKDEYQNRAKFIKLDNTIREDIIRYIFDEERKNRKNGKR